MRRDMSTKKEDETTKPEGRVSRTAPGEMRSGTLPPPPATRAPVAPPPIAHDELTPSPAPPPKKKREVPKELYRVGVTEETPWGGLVVVLSDGREIFVSNQDVEIAPWR